MTTICGTTSGELRLNYNGVEAVYKIAHINRIDVNHKLLEVTGHDSYFREYVDAGYSEINLHGMLLHPQTKPMSEKDWADVAGIAQAAGTAIPSATEQYAKHVAICRSCFYVDRLPAYFGQQRCAIGKPLVRAACKERRARRAVSRGFDARRYKDKYGAYYTAESFASAIANAFYDGEEQRAAYAARVDECASDYSW
jgi:hypothetical protein